jgi:uncharacterized protein YfiM (DUF2279 family)
LFFKFKTVIILLILLGLAGSVRDLQAEPLPKTFRQYLQSLSKQADEESRDEWFGSDKGYHIVGSLITTTLAGQFSLYGLETNRRDSQLIAAGISLTLGIVKEIHDSKEPDNHFSWKDLTADVVGILIGVTLLGIK